MRKLVQVILSGLIAISGLISAASAQGAAPDFRFIVTQDVDFYGSDLDALFDTDLPSCVRVCSTQTACTGFTFNTRSNACFPKSAVSDRTPYVGAVSAEKRPTLGAVYLQAEMLARSLDFLSDTDRTAARTQAQNLGLTHRAGGLDVDALLDAARSRADAGDLVQAMHWMGAAVSLTDLSVYWSEYADLLLNIPTKNSNQRRDYRNRAVQSAINAYLRGETAGAQSRALILLATALEKSGRGRQMIPALRLANDTQPRDDIETALETAIAKYGFRITDSTVESDAAAPRICAQFSEPLVKAGVDYEPFVRLPDAGLVVQADGNQLCIDGVEHGKRYRMTFRRGLPAASGETLHKDVELGHYVRDRSPSVAFPGRSYILPKSADAALPVETVNATELDLNLRRVSDRNLLRAMQDGYFGRPLSKWEDEGFASDVAEEIWTGSAQVQTELNREMTTRLPMGEAIAGLPAGIYALRARIPGADPWDTPAATQWFVLTDLGLSTMSGNDGLHVTVRGLSDAQPKAGIAVSLISRANAVLAQAETDAVGYARFDPGLTRGTGGAAPAMVIAEQGDTDLAFLSLTDPAFDLSDRGVEGRAPAGPVDVFLTTDRGAYRAGETVFATALARDGQANAIKDLPLIAILTRPDGVEYRRLISDGGRAGGHVFALPVGDAAPRGSWKLAIHSDPKSPALATEALLIEDFLPERIDFDLALPDAPLRPGDSPPLTIDARYLFGAPGADLAIEGQVRLRATDTIAAWPGYYFGRHDAERRSVSSYFGGDTTDARGKAVVPIELPRPDSTGQPMQATVIARLADGSARPVERRLTAPVQPATPVIGIKPLFDDVVAQGTDAGFEIIALSPDLTPATMRVRWTLNRVETRYQWYQLYGDWNWEPITHRTRISTGEVELKGTPIRVASPVDWGAYELVVERLDGAYAAASIDFYTGWYVSADATSTPDRLDLSLDRDGYAPGDTATLRIVPRMAGTALITVMSDRVIARQAVTVTAGETLIPLTVTKDWGAGAYVTATVVRPMDVAAGQNPSRALGLAYATVEPVGKRLNVTIDAPDVARPRQTERVRVAVAGAAPGDQVWLTLAAVDEGILNLTAFQPPDPQGYYFGQRRLGVELRDVYGRLIDGMNGAMGTVRSGGDAGAGGRMQSPPPTQKLMAQFSGLVELGADGAAYINLDLPAFNGNVRLMAVAWTDTAVGQATTDMLVRDPVVVTATVPRFLAPGDQARILIDAVHADGPTGEMKLALIPTGSGLTLGTPPPNFTLTDRAKASFAIPVTAQSVGDPGFIVVLTTPDGKELRQNITLPVRANDPVISKNRRFALGAGDAFTFSTDVFAGFRPGTATATLSAGPLAKFDTPGLLASLDRYPYGCTEQVTSKAMPLLYLSSVAQATGLGQGPAIDARISAAIQRVLTRQATNGAFGLWRAASGDFWLDAYVTDFLGRARAQGHSVPDRAFSQALDNLRNRVNYAPDFDYGGGDIAYALMVLAREGAAAMGDLRYYVDVKGGAFATPIAAAQLGAALAAYGDQLRADAMFARAARMIGGQTDEVAEWRADYGTNLRDTAAVLALGTEAGSAAIQPAMLTSQITGAGATMSTQEAAWTLLAAHALIKSPEHSGLRVDGALVSGPFVQVMDDTAPGRPLVITTSDGAGTDITLTTAGVPEIAPQAGGTGYGIRRQYYTMEGEQLSQPTARVGERFVTVITVVPFEAFGGRLMIDDPLPAGFEIDNPSLMQSGDVRALDWLQLSDAAHSEFRSDRFLSAIDMTQAETVTLAYVVRAVTPGSFHHPAASVEDMYRPAYRARTDTGRMDITP